jgi:cation:H+ antiporter
VEQKNGVVVRQVVGHGRLMGEHAYRQLDKLYRALHCAARKKRSDILVGGILGSFAYNLLVTLGLAATIHALPVDSRMTVLALPVMIGVHLTLLALVWYGKIPRGMGGLLVAAYLVYLVAVVLA